MIPPCADKGEVHGGLIDLNEIPIHGDLRLSKRTLPSLPPDYVQVSDSLGYRRGALRQYRGPHNIHVLEYPDEWSFHRDHVDPRADPMGHLIEDAPEIVLSVAAALLAGAAEYAKTSSLSRGIAAGGVAAVLTWGFLSILEEAAKIG